MRKSLVLTLALIFVLGIASTALAANPFTDVPANHWAYASIAKLADSGVIDGYGDGTFIGNRTMTRYEMAQIVAKAMARADKADNSIKAQIEKLAAEFAGELDSLGVRVAKLEKNADNVKITGEIRFESFRNTSSGGSLLPSPGLGDKDTFTLRSRIWLTGQVNDRWNYGGMLENRHDFQTNHRSDNPLSLRRAWVNGSVGDIKVTAGAFNYYTVNGVVMDNDMDGLVLGYGKNKWNIELFAGRPDFGNGALGFNPDDVDMHPIPVDTGMGLAESTTRVAMYGAVLKYDFTDKFYMQGAWYNLDDKNDTAFNDSINMFELNASYKFTDRLSMWAQYFRGDDSNNHPDVDKNGWGVRLDYSNVQRDQAGTWGLRLGYYDVPMYGNIATTFDHWTSMFGGGFKGYHVGGTYVMAKNITFNVDYWDFKVNEVEELKDRMLYTYVNFYF